MSNGIKVLNDYLSKAGPFVGPRGGKWADAKHTIPWKEGDKGKGKGKAGEEDVPAEISKELLATKQGVGVTLTTAKELARKKGSNEETGIVAMNKLIESGDLVELDANPKFPKKPEHRVYYPKGGSKNTREEQEAKDKRSDISLKEAQVLAKEAANTLKAPILTKEQLAGLAEDANKVAPHNLAVSTRMREDIKRANERSLKLIHVLKMADSKPIHPTHVANDPEIKSLADAGLLALNRYGNYEPTKEAEIHYARKVHQYPAG